MITVVIIPHTKPTPVGKRADAELHFTAGPLAGLKLCGFAVWESNWPDRRTGRHVRITVPAREYVNAAGQAKRWDLLRAQDDDSGTTAATDLRDAILDAYEAQDAPIEQATQIAREVTRAAQQAQVPARRSPQAAPRYTPPPAVTRRAPRPAVPQRRTTVANSQPPEPPPPTDDDWPF